MSKFEIGDHVIVRDNENRYYGEPAIVVSFPLKCHIEGISTEVVAVKLFSKNYGFCEERWQEIFMVIDISHLIPDTEQKFDMKRIEIKFGHFWQANFLKKELCENDECAFCSDFVKKTIEMNHNGCIYQYHVCSSCAKQWDSKRTDGPPLKVKKDQKVTDQ